MAWIFLSGSMLMPSLAPMDKADPALTLGRRTVQVRGRLRSHLENFIRDYGEGLDFSEVEDNPYADYTCRFYATPEDFGEAMKRAMVGIDYHKFKDTSMRKDAEGKPLYEKASIYHGVLMSIWSITQRIHPAGGWYAPRSDRNPKGYDRMSYGSSSAPRLGSSFLGDNDRWWDDVDDSFDYIPAREERTFDLLVDLEGIPVDQWEDELTEEDFALVKPHMAEARRAERRLERTKRKARYRRNKGRKVAKHRA